MKPRIRRVMTMDGFRWGVFVYGPPRGLGPGFAVVGVGIDVDSAWRAARRRGYV